MKYFNTYSFLVFVFGLLAGCSLDKTSPLSNVNNSPKKVYSETKWSVDPITNSKLFMVLRKEYDTEGKLVKYLEFSQTGSVSTEKKYSYSKNTSEESTVFYGLEGKVDSTINNFYSYDVSGNISIKITTDKLGDTISIQNFEYDSKGNLIKKIELNPDGKLKSETNYSNNYNQSGNLVERLINPGNNGSYELKEVFTYKMQNNQIEKRSYDAEGNVNIISTYTYDSDGRITSETQSGTDGKALRKFVTEYTFYK